MPASYRTTLIGQDGSEVPIRPKSGVPVAGGAFISTYSFTRPSNVTAYAAGQSVANATATPVNPIIFPACAREADAGGVIIGGDVIDMANQATTPQFELWVFDRLPFASGTGDGTAVAWTNIDLEKNVAIINAKTAFIGSAGAGSAGNLILPGTVQGQASKAYICDASLSLYGLLIVRNAYTPISAERFILRLHVLRD